MTLDELRAARPALGFAIYAYAPGGPVTLEIHDADGSVYAFKGATEAAAIAAAFPSEKTVDSRHTNDIQKDSVFD